MTDLSASTGSSGESSVGFIQAYRSNTYTDRVRKTLAFVREAGSWKIVLETREPLP